jgi:hypothetical protein
MPGFKRITVSTATGRTAQYEPIQLSLALTPDQKAVVSSITGQSSETLDLTTTELRGIMLAGIEWTWRTPGD